MATVNTVVTGAGTVAGGVALYTGISKAKIDKKVKQLEDELARIDTMSDKEFFVFLKNMAAYEEALEEYNSVCAEKKSFEQKSKSLGNWRTGMMAVNTATAVAGTVIAGKNYNDGRSMAERITECKDAAAKLKSHMGQARLSNDMNMYNKLDKIINQCDLLSPKHLDKVYKHSKVAKISSTINIGTGVAGTVTSAVANSSKIRNDNTESGQTKEKNLNTAANIFAGASTVASGVSTVFNAKTIKAINDNIKYAQQCEEALQ